MDGPNVAPYWTSSFDDLICRVGRKDPSAGHIELNAEALELQGKWDDAEKDTDRKASQV